MNKKTTINSKSADKKESTMPLPRMLDPVSAVDSIVTKALDTSARKMVLANPEACLDCLKKREPTAFHYYRYNIAKELGEVLGTWSNNIKSVFVCCYDEEVNGDDFRENLASFSLIHMIILVEKKSKALDALIDTIESSLVQRHRQMFGQKHLEHALDARIIDDDDVKNRTGYAMLLRSVYQPPIKLWERGL